MLISRFLRWRIRRNSRRANRSRRGIVCLLVRLGPNSRLRLPAGDSGFSVQATLQISPPLGGPSPASRREDRVVLDQPVGFYPPSPGTSLSFPSKRRGTAATSTIVGRRLRRVDARID